MDIKETFQFYRSDTVLLSNTDYYKYIFKKTEKIVCAVFYILEHTDKGHSIRVADMLAVSADAALRAALATLSRPWYAAGDELLVLVAALTALGSHVRVAGASGLLEESVADMLTLEIGTVQKSIRPFLAAEKQSAPDLTEFSMATPSKSATDTPRANASVRTERRVSAGVSTQAAHGARQARQQAIKDILATKGQSTIKDISDGMPAVSEKTVQRELMAMIEVGIVKKEGERRWSRYSLSDRGS